MRLQAVLDRCRGQPLSLGAPYRLAEEIGVATKIVDWRRPQREPADPAVVCEIAWHDGRLRQRALAATTAVAAAYGLAHDEAIVIHSGSNVLVHMRPAPAVARVMTGTVALHDDPATWLKREISVLESSPPPT